MPSRSLFRFAVFVTAFVLVHIKIGAIVTSTGSGMAFTDWPLSAGSLWPPGMSIDEFVEHFHRASGATVGLLAIGMLVWIYRVDPRRWVRGSAWVLLIMITVQGLLGGLGVLMGKEGGVTWAPAAVGHGVLAQPTLCLTAFLAFALSRGWGDRLAVPAGQAKTSRVLAGVAFGLVFLQIAIGAVVRHTNAQNMLWLHVFMAIVVSLAILISTAYNSGKFADRSPGMRALSRWIWTLLILQLLLGFATLIIRRPKDPSNIEYLGRSMIATAHVVIGATVFVLATLLLARSWRTLEPVAEGGDPGPGAPPSGSNNKGAPAVGAAH